MESTRSIIRVGLLGDDASTRQLVHAVAHSREFQLLGFCELDTMPQDGGDPLPRASLSGARQFDSWEVLLDLQVVDAVVVARGVDEDRRADQLRKLIQVGMPLVVSHPVVDSMLVYYELDMIRRETLCTVVPYLPARLHPAIRGVAAWVAEGSGSPIGQVEQVIVERALSVPTKVGVMRQFARDVDLIRRVAGDMTRLGAMGAGGDASGHSSLGVQMSGPRGIVARWSVDPAENSQGARLGVLGSRGKATVTIPAEGEAWKLELAAAGRSDLQVYDDWSPAAAALAQLRAALGGVAPEPDWVDAARSVELAETIERSLVKGRTIELYYEDYTEEGTFKGTMTSVGCGLLLIGLFLLGAVAIAEQMGLPYVQIWPYVLLGALGVFLLLQVLVVVSRRDDAKPRDDANSQVEAPPPG